MPCCVQVHEQGAGGRLAALCDLVVAKFKEAGLTVPVRRTSLAATGAVNQACRKCTQAASGGCDASPRWDPGHVSSSSATRLPANASSGPSVTSVIFCCAGSA